MQTLEPGMEMEFNKGRGFGILSFLNFQILALKLYTAALGEQRETMC